MAETEGGDNRDGKNWLDAEEDGLETPPLDKFRVNAPTWLAWMILFLVGGLVIYCDFYELRHLPKKKNPTKKESKEPEVLDFRPLRWLPNDPPQWYLDEQKRKAEAEKRAQEKDAGPSPAESAAFKEERNDG